MNTFIAETKSIIMNTFIVNTEDNGFYDVDMFINDVERNIQDAYTGPDGKDLFESRADKADAKRAFECAVIDAIREIDIYEWYGAAGCVIIVAELFDFAKEFFNEAD